MKLDLDLTENQIKKIKKMLEEEKEKEIEFVEIPNRSYRMSKFLVTQAQWESVMGNNPSKEKGDNKPVTNVSFFDVQEFIKKLNESQDEWVYDLPSEDEWEYCAGEDPEELGEYAWYCKNSISIQEVGTKKPNSFGLYDMLGNVWEWTKSEY